MHNTCKYSKVLDNTYTSEPFGIDLVSPLGSRSLSLSDILTIQTASRNPPPKAL